MSEEAGKLIHNPTLKLEDARDGFFANECGGRGSGTAAARGYNVERLSWAVFHPDPRFMTTNFRPHYDMYTPEVNARIECKSCVDQYPSGVSGRFRIWKKHHRRLLQEAQHWQCVYFFVVYTIENEIEKEVGKLVVPIEQMDEILDSWSERDHTSMGQTEARDLSWTALLKQLDISRAQFRNNHIVDLTVDSDTEHDSD